MIKFEKDRDKYISCVQGIWIVLCAVLLCIYIPLRVPVNELLEMLTLFVIFLVFETLASNSIQLWSGRRRFDYVYKPVVAMTLGMSVANTIVSIVLVLLSEQKGYARIVGHVVTYLCFGLIVFTLNTLRGKKLFEKNI